MLVVGESGSGKSRVLEQALAARREPYGISELRRSDAVEVHLQRALAQVLRAHLAAGANPGEVRDRLRGALVRLGGRYTQAAMSAVTRRVLDVLTRGVAPEIQRAFEDLAEELAAGAPERILERLQEASDGSPLEQLLELAAEVRDIVGGPINLGLDRGEYLSDADVDLLLDLADEPQDIVSVFVAIRSDHRRGQRVLERMNADAPHLVAEMLSPVGEADVRRIAPELPREDQRQLLDLSGGNPRRIADALHVPSERWSQTQRLALALTERLSVEDRNHARALSVMPFPPTAVTVRELLGLNDREWDDLRRRLEVAGVIDLNGWIHEARRDELMADESFERARLAMDAVRALSSQVADNEDLLGQFLELAHLAASALPAEAARVLYADLEMLAVIAAWFELQSMERQRPLLARTVALYAHAQWAAPLLDATGWERVARSGIIELQTSAAGQVLVDTPHLDEVAFLLVRARLLTELGRVPVPYLAEMVMTYGLGDVLGGRPNSGPRVGVTAPSDLLPDEAALRSPREDAETLLITARFRGVPVGVAVRFVSGHDRERARRRLQTDRRAVFGKTLVVSDVVAGPPRAQPSERFFLAAEFAGLDLNTMTQHGLVGSALAEGRSEMLHQLRSRLSPAESLVAALDQSIALGVVERNRERLSVEFRGTREGVVDISSASAALTGNPFRALRQVDDLISSYGEHVGASNVELFAGREHPLPWAIERIAHNTRIANRKLPREVIDMSEERVQARLTAGLERLTLDANLLKDLAGEGEHQEVPTGLIVFLPATVASPMWRKGEPEALALWTSGRSKLTVEIRRRDDIDFYEHQDFGDLVRAAGVDAEQVVRGQFSSVQRLLASILGYQDEDIEPLGAQASFDD